MCDRSVGLRRVEDAMVEGKTVLLRVDYNVPLRDGEVADDARIRASLPTLRYLLEQQAKVVIMAHLGRPKGSVVPELRLDRVAARLEELLGETVHKLDDCMGQNIEAAVNEAEPGEILMLENLRFHDGEGANSHRFAQQMAGLADLFVNDAFATLHRSHASTLGVTDVLPSFAGMLIQKEVENLSKLVRDPDRPYVAIVGGKKAQSKLGALRDLVEQVDKMLIGGGVAFSFLKAQGHSIGESLFEERILERIQSLLMAAEDHDVDVCLPTDVVIARQLSDEADTETCAVEDIPDGWMGLDIGPKTTASFVQEIASAKSAVWAGPMGAFEVEPFSNGTRKIAEALANCEGFTVVGGGETGEAVIRMGMDSRMSFVSTGGGASLAYLRGKRLAPLEALCE